MDVEITGIRVLFYNEQHLHTDATARAFVKNFFCFCSALQERHHLQFRVVFVFFIHERRQSGITHFVRGTHLLP